ncbi:hypothetical protein CcrKarma_gp048 [Caulobacter virus Karma]|uniref:Uncharacterized protein n=5 Tax=Viruses TaxID=10239 RepID=K4JNV4_9CAUD|nr:hypothetical protein D865_gp047 [Caulobacter phage phiCbK]YP_006989428.1 hypothetical protein CcrKarma_gp048 [Caulobacter virus Karma]ARB14966.1 hypothetical protein Ccr32_gp047 [Caulobacter phage Ccr32]ARB15297.1 hypothetical protein Ccr34_gp048 [Caulobacter phage Ccr34]AFO71788.1 hypothetical protein phiCbK_272 [Caulobacter phage phiCbK]AFU86879.1 hypothetical protein CbK_gp047 [Caulobacter phage phiCbK]AFU87565.1 hypothetical protein CcrKarma_gp048 [Caulobacter virus Karma]
MTTAVDIQAAGHNLIVYLTDIYVVDGEAQERDSIEFVRKGAKRTFHVHQTRDLYVTEVRDAETDLNALIDAGDEAAARQYIAEAT